MSTIKIDEREKVHEKPESQASAIWMVVKISKRHVGCVEGEIRADDRTYLICALRIACMRRKTAMRKEDRAVFAGSL